MDHIIYSRTSLYLLYRTPLTRTSAYIAYILISKLDFFPATSHYKRREKHWIYRTQIYRISDYIEQTASPEASTVIIGRVVVYIWMSGFMGGQLPGQLVKCDTCHHYQVVNPRPAADGVASLRPCPGYPSHLPAAASVYVFSGRCYLNSCSSSRWISRSVNQTSDHVTTIINETARQCE